MCVCVWEGLEWLILRISQIEFSNVGPGRPPVRAKRGAVGGKEPKKGLVCVCVRVGGAGVVDYLHISQIKFSNVEPGRQLVGAKRGVVGGKEPSLPKKGNL